MEITIKQIKRIAQDVVDNHPIATEHDRDILASGFTMMLEQLYKEAAQQSVQLTADNVAQNDPFKTVSISGKPKRGNRRR